MKAKGFIVLCVGLILVLIVSIAGVVVSNDSNTSDNTEYEQNNFVSDYLPGEENLDGNTCENLKNNAFVAKQGKWIYYAADDDLFKKNENTGETILLHSNEYLKSISVCKNYIYYISSVDGTDTIYRILTDGTFVEEIADSSIYFFENEWIYFVSSEPSGMSSTIDTICKVNVNDISDITPVYALKTNEHLDGVYNKKIIVSDHKEYLKLINVSDYTEKGIYWNGLTSDMHFDQGDILCVDEYGVNVLNISTEKTYKINGGAYFEKISYLNIANGNHFFVFTIPNFGYAEHNLVCLNDNNYIELDSTSNMVLHANTIENKLYYTASADGYSFETEKIACVNSDGSDWQLVWSK